MTRSPRKEDVSEVIWEPKFIRHEQAYLSNFAKSDNPSYMASNEWTIDGSCFHTRKISFLGL